MISSLLVPVADGDYCKSQFSHSNGNMDNSSSGSNNSVVPDFIEPSPLCDGLEIQSPLIKDELLSLLPQE